MKSLKFYKNSRCSLSKKSDYKRKSKRSLNRKSGFKRKSKRSLNRKSGYKRKSKRSLNRKSGYKRKSKRSLNRKWDGMMDASSENTKINDNPIPSSENTKIKLENYIEDIKLFYDKSFLYTISSFKMFKTNGERNDTFDFIKELFNFHDKDNINEIFYNKSSILRLIIIEGLYEEFEKLIDDIKINEGLPESKSNDDIIKTKLETFLKKIKINRTTQIENEIKKFVCIDSDIRKYIMRHYLLHFIKSEDFYNYSSKDKIDTSSDNEKNKEIIDRFLMNIGKFKKLPYINTDFTKDDDKKYIFNTCGETTLLNLLNYYFIEDSGVFNAIGSDELKNFYLKFNTMDEQIKDIEATTHAWLEVVSNLKKSEEEEKEVRLYNDSGDIHNNVKNIIFVLKTILGSEEDEITEILKSISISISHKHNIETISEEADIIEFSLDDNYRIFFKPGHGDFYYKLKEEHKIKLEKNDFSMLYNNIFKLINWKNDYNKELAKKILEILEILKANPKYLDPILKSFTNNIKILDLTNIQLTTLPEEHLSSLKELIVAYYNTRSTSNINLSSLSSLSSLEYLTLYNIKLEKFPDSIRNLKNLKYLSLQSNKLITLPDIIKELTNLKNLSLAYNKLTILPDSIGKLTKLQYLYLNDNQLTTLPSEIQNLTNLQYLELNNNQLTTLPSEMQNLTNLQYLKLNNNQLTTLPSEIGSLSSLKKLTLSHNQLTELPDSIGSLSSLKKLTLSHNQLTELPESIGSLSSLEGLDLQNNKLTKLPDSIGSLSSLKELSLYNNELTELPESIEKLLRSLKVLHLGNNKLNDEIIDKLKKLNNEIMN